MVPSKLGLYLGDSEGSYRRERVMSVGKGWTAKGGTEGLIFWAGPPTSDCLGTPRMAVFHHAPLGHQFLRAPQGLLRSLDGLRGSTSPTSF